MAFSSARPTAATTSSTTSRCRLSSAGRSRSSCFHYGDVANDGPTPKKLRQYQRQLREKKVVRNFEVETRLRDGKTKWFLLSSVWDEETSSISGFSMDITETREARSTTTP